jgi:hypothetical protein
MIVTFRRAWKPAKGSSRSCLTFLSAPHRVAHRLKPGLLLGLDQVLGQPARLLLGLGKFVGECMPIFGLPGPDQRRAEQQDDGCPNRAGRSATAVFPRFQARLAGTPTLRRTSRAHAETG